MPLARSSLKLVSVGSMIIIPDKRQILQIRQSDKFFNFNWVFMEGKLIMVRHKYVQVKGRKGGRQFNSDQNDKPDHLKQLYRYQARQRAGQNIYQLVHENNLSKMWSLTYGDEITDRKKALNDFMLFVKRLSYQLDKKIKYVAVMEVQKEREKKYGKPVLHFHMAMEDFYIKKSYFQDIWGHGNVYYSKYKDGRKIDNDKVAVATYMSKYLKKDMEDNPQLAGQKMYLNSKGLNRPPKGNGIVEDEKFDTMRDSGFGYDIKDRPDIEGFSINFKSMPIKVKQLEV